MSDPGDENDNFRHSRGETIRNMVSMTYNNKSDNIDLLDKMFVGINLLMDWCDNKEITAREFSYERSVFHDEIGIMVKGVQR